MDFQDAAHFCGAEPDDDSGSNICSECGKDTAGFYDAIDMFLCRECWKAEAERRFLKGVVQEQESELVP